MRGFGASFTESSHINLNSLPPQKQEQLLDVIFSSKSDAAGLTAMKLPMASNDFSAAGPWSTYDDHLDDAALVHFSIARDLHANGTLSLALRARAHGFNGQLQSYMDYPPDWMLEGSPPDGRVSPKHYDTLALYYAKFVQSYARHNVTIDYLSLFNEPTGYTKIYPGAMARLLGKHVGPLFDRLGLRNRTKLTYGGAVDRATAMLMTEYAMADPLSRSYMDHLAYHGYDCNFGCLPIQQNYELAARMHARWPELEMWMTETCYAYGAGYPRNASVAPPLPRLDFLDGRTWGSRMVSDIEAGVSGWIYWNLILDMSGGPFLLSPSHGDGDANWQQAVVHVDAARGEYHLTGLFYYLAHFARFVRPAAVRVKTTLTGGSSHGAPEGTAGAQSVAFVDPGGHVVLQLLNHALEEATVTVYEGSRSATFALPAASITTASWT